MAGGVSFAELQWLDGDVPHAVGYGDLYYSRQDGLAEARHVFLAGNHLAERLAGSGVFTVAETGFGTGLNFLALLALWDGLPEPKPSIRYFTLDRHPMRLADMERAHAAWPELEAYARMLREIMPHPFPGRHQRFLFRGRVELVVFWGEALDALASMTESVLVDAWFLDGFAPAQNLEMWQESLYQQVARLSCVGCSLASFTSAGHVRRGLEAVGFQVAKMPGYGRKREIINAVYKAHSCSMPQKAASDMPAVVVGAGIAGISAAWHLARHGREVLLLEAGDGLCSGASGNPAAAVTPYFTADWSERGQFYASGFGLTLHLWQMLEQAGHLIEGEHCGVLALDVDEATADRHARLLAKLALPESVMQPVSAMEASEIAGVVLPVGGVFYPEGGWVRMPSFCRALLAHAGDAVQLLANSTVAQLDHDGRYWRVQLLGQCHPLITDHLVLANGFAAKKLLPELPLEAVRGQMLTLQTPPMLAGLKTVLNFGLYLTPPADGVMGCGSSFIRHDVVLDIRDSETELVLQQLCQMFSELEAADLRVKSWVNLRCATPQRMPLIGQYREGLYLHLAHGARGMLSGMVEAL